MDGDSFGRVLYLVLLLTAVGGWVVVEFRQRMAQTLRLGLAWGLIFLGVIAGYGLWNDIRRDVLPRQMVTTGGELILPRANDGHYYAEVSANGTRLRVLADTGASMVVLSPADARRMGIDTANLVYTGQAMTANGTVRTARTTIDTLDLGPFQDRNVPVWVNQADMDVSLLGMDYLGRFRIEIDADQMVLRR
jgi:aspartyl protease family protein